MMNSNISDNFEILSSTSDGARLLVETVIESYGVQDFLRCVFFGLNETDQAQFLSTALRKAGAVK